MKHGFELASHITNKSLLCSQWTNYLWISYLHVTFDRLQHSQFVWIARTLRITGVDVEQERQVVLRELP